MLLRSLVYGSQISVSGNTSTNACPQFIGGSWGHAD